MSYVGEDTTGYGDHYWDWMRQQNPDLWGGFDEGYDYDNWESGTGEDGNTDPLGRPWNTNRGSSPIRRVPGRDAQNYMRRRWVEGGFEESPIEWISGLKGPRQITSVGTDTQDFMKQYQEEYQDQQMKAKMGELLRPKNLGTIEQDGFDTFLGGF